jgi:hypothetical protein
MAGLRPYASCGPWRGWGHNLVAEGEQAGARFGYTRWAMINLVRERARVIDFGSWSARLDTTRAGLLLVPARPGGLDLPRLIARAGYPG